MLWLPYVRVTVDLDVEATRPLTSCPVRDGHEISARHSVGAEAMSHGHRRRTDNTLFRSLVPEVAVLRCRTARVATGTTCTTRCTSQAISRIPSRNTGTS